MRYPGGADTAYSYDTAGRLSEIDHGLFESMTYEYDKAGDVTSSERTAGTISQSDIGAMTYDAATRLLGRTHPILFS